MSRRTMLALAATAVSVAAFVHGPVAASTDAGMVLRYDGAGHGPDYSTDVAVPSTGGRFFVAGSTYGGLTRGDDITTIAYGETGQQLWVSSFNGVESSIDQANGVAVGPLGGRVFVTGYSWGGSDTQNDALTVSYAASTGDPLWAKRYDGPGHGTDAAADIVVSPGGRTIYVTGATADAAGALDALTVAYDAVSGARRWVARLGGADYDEGLAIGISPDGSRVFVAGYRTGTASIDLLIVAYDAHSGDPLWTDTVDAEGDEVGRAVAVAPDGTAVFVTGASSGGPTRADTPSACQSLRGSGSIGADYITAAYDPGTGQRVWLKNYDGPDHDCDEAYGLAVSPDSSAAFVTGSSFSLSSDSDAATVAYQADDGATRWVARYDGPDHLFDQGDSVAVAPDGSRVYVSGLSTGASTDYDFITVFYDAVTGAGLRVERYDGPGHAFDAPNAIAVHPGGGAVYVTGGSTGSNLDPDYATVIYRT